MNILLLPSSAQLQQHHVIKDAKQVEHIQNILGLTVGDSIKVGCLSGKIGTAVISQMNVNGSKKQVVLTDINCNISVPKKLDLTIVLALPRPKVLRRLIIDMTAIGVKHIILVNSYRTHKSYWQSPMLKRLDEFVVEGLQQGCDTFAPTISIHKRFKPFVEDELSVLAQSNRAVVAHPYTHESFSRYQQLHGLPNIICVGAEGGWIDYEIDLLTANGCQVVSLGSRVLRTEAVVNVLSGRYL